MSTSVYLTERDRLLEEIAAVESGVAPASKDKLQQMHRRLEELSRLIAENTEGDA